MNFATPPDPAYAAMQDWMQQWTDLETRLSVLLLAPAQQGDFAQALHQVHERMCQLLALDADSSLYWLLQLAASSTVSYSASHAMICATLCHLSAPALGFNDGQTEALTLAALTMNIGMTALQNQLTEQTAPPNAEQRQSIEQHPALGAKLLRERGITSPLWLHVVERHHDPRSHDRPTRLLMAADRYAALISPRETRPGKCITDSGRHVVVSRGATMDEVGHALLKTVGICPPGTFVRLDDGRVAVVLRRTERPGQPWVASVMDAAGHPVVEPELVDTATDGQGIEAALVTRSVRVRLNHSRLLQLSRMAVARR